MRLLYSKPKLNNLSQGERIAFIRKFRKLTQDDASLEISKEASFNWRMQKNIESDGLMELIKWIMFGISGMVVSIWFAVMKFANYIKKEIKKIIINT